MGHFKTILFFFICVMLFSFVCQAKSPAGLVEKGNSEYEKKQYDEALKAYDAAGVEIPESAEIYFNKGAAYYRKGEYDKAKEAWEKSALNTKDIQLEARSLFNLGNTAYQEVQRHQDSDPQKAIDACTQSISYYQQVLELLKNPDSNQDPELVKETSENIEMVRLVMKSMLDAMSKQQEQAKQQQQAADELKELIKKQQELIDRNQYYYKEQQDKGKSKDLGDNISQMVGDQTRLREETKDVTEKIPAPDPNQPDPVATAKEHLNQSQSEQQEAADKMTAEKLDEAAPHQESALKEMQNALKSLEKDKGQSGGHEKKDQQGQSQNAQNKSDQTENQNQREGSQEAQPQPQQQQQQQQQEKKTQDSEKWISGNQDDAQRILNEEKENQKNRLPESPGGYRDVDKDW
jgi:Ca-activated chloride channel homolog